MSKENEAYWRGYHNGYVCAMEDNAKLTIVRCKDCKYRFDGEHVYNCCEQLMEKSGWVTEIPVDDNWYCADGEKRKDGTKID